MTLVFASLLALLVQTAPATVSQNEKASVAGVVVNANGEPLPNIRVTLGRLNVPLGAFAQMLASERPQVEATLPAEFLNLALAEMTAEAQTGLSTQDAAELTAFKALPLGEIEELIINPAGTVAVVPKAAPPVVTDDRGQFRFTTVEPGTYRLIFSGAGYARQDYGQRTAAGGGVPLTLTAGQTKTDIVMRMLPVAAVSGRVRDAAGQALAGVPVELSRFSYGETGQRQVQRVTSTRTDDHGEYRMFYLSPGRYYVSAGNPPGQNARSAPGGIESLLGGVYTSANRIPENYTRTYYPGVPDPNSATALDVPPGADVRGIDFLLNVQQTYKVRGRLVDSATGLPPQRANITVALQNPALQGLGSSFGNPGYIATNGSFELQNISAGAYVVSAIVPSPAQPRPPDVASQAERDEYRRAQEAAESARPRASVAVNVFNADVDGVLLTLGPSGSIPGRLRLESNSTESLQLVRVQLRQGTVTTNNPYDSGPQARPVSADGTFRIDNILPGEYRTVFTGLPPGFYVKEARLGDTDALNAPLVYRGTSSGTLDVLISSQVGTLEGGALDASGRPMPGAQVVLIPARNRERTELFRPVTADVNGHFSIPAVAPGEYTLAAWEAIEPFAFFDPNLIQQAEANGKPVRIGESSSQTVNVTTIGSTR